jgi:hypothetical protein
MNGIIPCISNRIALPAFLRDYLPQLAKGNGNGILRPGRKKQLVHKNLPCREKKNRRVDK